MFKIKLTTKNSKWKIVQNVLKGNYYTDVVDFENKEDKDAFLRNEVGEDWDDLDSFVPINPDWEDEIHFSCVLDLEAINRKIEKEKEKLTRDQALRRDFAILYDTNQKDEKKRIKFYTIECSMIPNHIYNKVQLKAELDVFFTYDVKEIWKKNAEVAMERGVFAKQWDKDKPLLDINSPLMFAEPIRSGLGATIKTPSKELFSNEIEGFLVFIKPQKRYLTTKVRTVSGITVWNINHTVPDTIIIDAQSSNNKVENAYVYLQTTSSDNDDLIIWTGATGDLTKYVYPQYQKIGYDDKIYTKSDYYICLFLDKSRINDAIGEYDYTFGDILNSPDVIRIVPINFIPETKQELMLGVLKNNEESLDLFWDMPTIGLTGPLIRKVYVPVPFFTLFENTQVFAFNPLENVTNDLEKDEFSPNQYAKIWGGQNYFWRITNAVKQSIGVSLELLGSPPTATITRKQVFSLEGNFAKTTLDQGLYKFGNLRNLFAFEEVNNVTGFQNTDRWLNYASDNAQNINKQAAVQDRNKILGIISGGFSIASGSSVTASGLYGLRQSLKQRKENNTEQGDESSKIGESMVLSSSVLGGAANIASGIGSILTASNSINLQAAQLADAQSAKNSITTTGSEFDKIQVLDGSYTSLRMQLYELPDSLKKSTAMFYHRFGYALNGTLASPLDYLSNGLRWDFFQAEFNSIYQALSEEVSPQEAKIMALSLSYGVRVWHFKKEFIDDFVVGDFSKRNIKT